MKTQVINLELLFSYDVTLGYDEINKIKYMQVLKDIDPTCDYIIGLLLLDGFLYKDNAEFKQFVKDMQAACGTAHLILVPGICQQIELDCDIMYFDYNLNVVCQSFKDCTPPRINLKADKLLFLTGRPDRPNRIRLTHKLWKAGLLDNAVWSFFKPLDSEAQVCRNIMHDVPADEYEYFLNSCENSVDTAYSESRQYIYANGKEFIDQQIAQTAFCNDPGWMNPSVFENTAFSIISEGITDPNLNTKFLSEKTWRTIINKHSFILAGTPDMYTYAKSIGLNMFEEFMLIKDYAMIQDDEERLDAIVTNARYFLNTRNTRTKEIETAIEHNYLRMFELARTNNNLLEYFISIGADPDSLDKYFNSKSHFAIVEVHNA